jgi:5-methylcytosine-specific restriction endonuclease McrA
MRCWECYKKSPNKYWLGKKRDFVTVQKIADSKRGKPSWNKGITGKDSHSFGNTNMLGVKHSDEYRRNMSKIKKATKNHLWIHGLGKMRSHYPGVEYKIWRDSVFKRDDYTCQFCHKRGVELQADHIKPWALYEELRYELNNGRTLCKPCHISTDTYGSKTRQLLKEKFI